MFVCLLIIVFEFFKGQGLNRVSTSAFGETVGHSFSERNEVLN